MSSPQALTTDGAGGVLVLETITSVLRRIFAIGSITTVAGTGVSGYSGDNGPATLAQLLNPTAALADSAGGIWLVAE
jgi:trimeric autotransporter adhesin